MTCKPKQLCDFSECDLLAITTIITREIAKAVKDIDVLNAVGDIVTAVGANITVLANQRDRCAKDIRVSTTS
ncbi:MAG: hypothetical protein FWE38_02530 [Firmicutes bacterium]|nr:hypothetical protein [Bacillota bacterium]